MTECLVIAVDGPAGSGKSSAARGAAIELGLRYLDTGAMYRALTWWLISRGLDTAEPEVVAKHVARPVIEVGTDPSASAVSLDGEDVSEVIRSRAVSSAVSAVASVPEVRARLVAMQRAAIVSACAEGQGIVAEGRDIGTVVAPQAIVKVFLTAAEDIRAQRRGADQGVTTGAIQDEQRSRDAADAPRTVMAADAVMVDSTALSLDEVVAAIVGLARDRSTGQRPRRPADAAWTT